jgi:hypothetical protein
MNEPNHSGRSCVAGARRTVVGQSIYRSVWRHRSKKSFDATAFANAPIRFGSLAVPVQEKSYVHKPDLLFTPHSSVLDLVFRHAADDAILGFV